jgi:hypothetical protein
VCRRAGRQCDYLKEKGKTEPQDHYRAPRATSAACEEGIISFSLCPSHTLTSSHSSYALRLPPSPVPAEHLYPDTSGSFNSQLTLLRRGEWILGFVLDWRGWAPFGRPRNHRGPLVLVVFGGSDDRRLALLCLALSCCCFPRCLLALHQYSCRLRMLLLFAASRWDRYSNV